MPVRGLMYYRKALELQAFLYMAKNEDLMEGYKAVELNMEDQIKGERSLWAQCQAVADMKFTYVVSCQQYGIDKRSGNPRAQDILRLMTTYVFRLKNPKKDASKKVNHKVYYSELVKVALPKFANSSEAVQNLDQVKTKALF
ncbi:Callose synthase 3 [Camellia lanceoleosa]|uniref:Callose synthase 3 n=1 Tax=Camellia lanceoleosa TaxID=1840588 RepID=A0ACC0G0V4_9ERIC|nr:Callose synthase 3 [Camellia lanceoleosa]